LFGAGFVGAGGLVGAGVGLVGVGFVGAGLVGTMPLPEPEPLPGPGRLGTPASPATGKESAAAIGPEQTMTIAVAPTSAPHTAKSLRSEVMSPRLATTVPTVVPVTVLGGRGVADPGVRMRPRRARMPAPRRGSDGTSHERLQVKGAFMRNVLFTAIFAVASIAGCKAKQSDTREQPGPNNTARNQRDHREMPVADQAVSAPGDLDTTQKIRRALVDDGTLSLDAHNCKIVVNDGTVTLDGPVRSVVERERVEQIAMAVVGMNQKVLNKLEVVTNN
jgi:hypothetical protein